MVTGERGVAVTVQNQKEMVASVGVFESLSPHQLSLSPACEIRLNCAEQAGFFRLSFSIQFNPSRSVSNAERLTVVTPCENGGDS